VGPRARAEPPAVPAGIGASGAPPGRPADPLELRPDGTFRPPDYRWRIAHRLAADEWVPDEWVDPWVLRAEELLTTPPSPRLDAPDLRAVDAARDLYERGPFWRKVEVEARLLAGEPAEAIATKSGLTAAAVAAYGALFYAVGDRLRHPAYIVHEAIGLHGAEADLGVQVRLLGYTGGVHVLDAVLDAVDRPGVRPDADVPAETRELRKLARLALGLRTTPVTADNAIMWIRLHLLRQECRRWGAE
jgi:hypothetical protein